MDVETEVDVDTTMFNDDIDMDNDMDVDTTLDDENDEGDSEENENETESESESENSYKQYGGAEDDDDIESDLDIDDKPVMKASDVAAALSTKTKGKTKAKTKGEIKKEKIQQTVKEYEEDDEGDDEGDDDYEGEDEGDERATDDNIEYDEYMKQMIQKMKDKYIVKYHPELNRLTYDEISALTKLVKDRYGNIIDPLHKTIPILTKYEKARILGVRAKQINSGASPLIELQRNIIDGYVIAEMELKQKRIPFIIERPLPNGKIEYWNVNDLEIIDY